jgi:hypothetical protein
LDDFVGSPSGLSSDYLPQRFARESERLWDEAAERAVVFDTMADRYDEMQLWSAPLRLLNRVSTSWVAIALPPARATPDPARGSFDWLAGVAVVAGGLLRVLSVAVRSDGGIKRLASPLPDLTVATPGLVLLPSAAFLTCAGLLSAPADGVTRCATSSARAPGDRGRVLIGIDELGKMRSEQAAEQFLNEIKSIFGCGAATTWCRSPRTPFWAGPRGQA